MADAVHNPEQEFWRAPLPTTAVPVASTLAGACAQCGTEFLMDSAFCHACGASRTGQVRSASGFAAWKRYFVWTRHLEFHAIQERLGLPTASLVAFVMGLGCVLGAIGVGIVFTANTVLDWQAVQLWRIEWLLGAVAAFLAGILLKTASTK
jgi:ribosomal protein L37E